METVVFGKPAAETVAEKARRRDAERVFLMVSGTLNRTTDEITKVRRALGNRFAGLFDHMPPHTPRQVVIEAAEMAREAGADLIVTVGGGSITDGGFQPSVLPVTSKQFRRGAFAHQGTAVKIAGSSLSSQGYSVRTPFYFRRKIMARWARRCSRPKAAEFDSSR